MIEHIAIIMDGIRRWAVQSGQPEAEGWNAGLRAAQVAVREAAGADVQNLTLFIPEAEVAGGILLDGLLDWEAAGLRVRYVGRRSLPEDNLAALERIERVTAASPGMSLNLALDFDGRIEIADAARRVAEDIQQGRLAPGDAGEENLVRYLYAPDIPDIDLLIRTGGEAHLAGFMLWQMAYAEIVFLDTLWPDFTPEHLAEAMAEFGRRVRKFGAINTI